MSENIKINSPEKIHLFTKKIVNNSNINLHYLNKNEDFRQKIIQNIDFNDKILDIGQSLRLFKNKLKNKKVDTLDINKFEDYPDIYADLCELEISKKIKTKYNKIICLAVLEHCYDPFSAIKNIYNLLENDGILYGYVPFLYNYHAPKDEKFLDFFRFSKDGVAFLLKDFKEIEIFPVRGKLSAILNMLLGGYWKNYLEKIKLNILVDKIFSKKTNIRQCSGFYFIAKK